MNAAQTQASLTATLTAIAAYEAAQLALGTGGVQSYLLDTGQTRQTVTKFDILDMQKALDILYNRCATLSARLGGASIIARPAW